MPRYTVHVRGEWLAVPCRDAQLTVGWLGREAVRRYIKNKPDNGGFDSADAVCFLVRRCKGLGLLDNEDPLEVALEDNEFVEVGEWRQGRAWSSFPPVRDKEKRWRLQFACSGYAPAMPLGLSNSHTTPRDSRIPTPSDIQPGR